MKITITHDKALRFVGINDQGLEAIFDTSIEGGGLNSSPSPVESVAMAAGACTAMDVVAMINKRRKKIESFKIEIEFERATEHPKVITKLHMAFHVKSPDLTSEELERSIKLSQETYCTVSIMVRRSGCDITWSHEITR
jgi:putative redox protein